MTRIQLGILFLIIMIATGGSVASSGEINTSISAEGPYCWYDDTHVIVLQRTRPSHGDLQTEGLFVLDVMKPHELTRLDLAPLPLDVQREFSGLSCQDQTIVLSRSLPTPQVPELYTMTLSSPPERLAAFRGHSVSLRGHYLLGSNAKVVNDGGPEQGTFEGRDDCDVRFVRPGFRVLCWDPFQFRGWWPLTNWVMAEYLRQETIKSRTEQGTKRVPNPTPPLLGKDGKPVAYGVHLRDLTGNIVASLMEDSKYAPWAEYGLPITPDEAYVYAACSKGPRPIGLADRVCRYRLDGQPHEWEEVFRFDVAEQLKTGITKISVSDTGDVYFALYGAQAPHDGGIWRFNATSRRIEQLTSSSSQSYQDADPSVSPHGTWAIFVRKGKDGAKFMLLQGGAR